jgi:O-succinylbenzoic acid--CoA ligase
MLVEGWLARAAAARPDRTALETPTGSWSYSELLAAATAGAAELRARGARPGAQVAIALPAGLSFAQALHACLLLGAVAVPVDTRLTEAERRALLAGVDVVVEDPLDDDRAASGRGVHRAHGASGARGGARERPLAMRSHELDAPAVLLYTSGTSGEPRPVELTYGNLLWSALGSAAALGLDASERWLCALPVSHVAGLSILVRSAIYGTTAVVHERFETDRVLHTLREHEITIASFVATTLARLLEAGLEGASRLRCALTGGGPVPSALLAAARTAGVPVALTYGLTEACSQVTTTPWRLMAREGPVPGPPLFCTRVRIAGLDGAGGGAGEGGASAAERAGELSARTAERTGELSARTGEGEILVAGPTVAPRSRARDGWLHTGDVGFLDESGALHVSGRLAETIISGGEKVSPAEVEGVLESHPDVLEAAVVGRADDAWGEAVTAIVVPRPGHAPTAEVLRGHCARVLAPYKVPREVVLRAEPLPRTRSGKLQRGKLH